MIKSFFNKNIILLILLLVPLATSAQLNINLDGALQSELNVEVIPTYPKPNSTVFIQLEMYSEDLDKAEITWNQDNKIFVKENGRKTYSFNSGPSGTETNIEVRVKLANGKTFYKSMKIKPVGVDLIWQSDSYVPPFFKGKALHPKQGNLTIVAMPDFTDSKGDLIPKEKLIYKWSDGTNAFDSQSGYGKNVLRIEGSLLGRTDRVEVLVTSPTESGAAFGIIEIPTTEPEVLFYEISPFYGPILNRAIPRNLDLSGEEVEIMAAPFYTSLNNTATLSWRLNGARSGDLANSRTVIFRKPEGVSGSSRIDFSVENLSKILQQPRGSFNINFKE